jgi:hypothetical protein
MESRLLGRLAIGVLIACFLLANLKKGFSTTLTASPEDTQGWRPVLKTNESKAVKVIVSPFMNRSRAQQRQQHKRVFLIHVGKTGGETVRHTLKITCRMRKNEFHQQACWDAFNGTQESELSKHTVGTMHCDLILPKKGMDRATTLLWTIRNPLTRIISWFRYLNPANCNLEEDYYSTACNTNRSIFNNLKKADVKSPKWATKFFSVCFPTMNDFARALGTASASSAAVGINNKPESLLNCTDLAWRTIRGLASPSSSHAYFNYKYYWQETIEKYPGLEVWAVRTEYLWEDLDGIEFLLNSRRGMHSHGRKNVTHGSESHAKRGDLSAENKRIMCCALQDEMIYYEKVLARATNLGDTSRDQALSKVIQECGINFFSSGSNNASSSCV